MNKNEADKIVNAEIEKRRKIDELCIEDGPSGFLGPVGDGKLLFRTVERRLNREARENLLEQINQRMAAVNNTLVWKLKYALDKAEFARTHILTEDPSKVDKFLRDAARLTRAAIADFQRDAEAFYTLADVARQIKKSEEENEHKTVG